MNYKKSEGVWNEKTLFRLVSMNLKERTSHILIISGQFPTPWGGTRVQGLPWGSYHFI